MSASEPNQDLTPLLPHATPARPPAPPGRPPVPPAPPGFGDPSGRPPGDDWFRHGRFVPLDKLELLARRKRLLRALAEAPFDPLVHRRLGELLLASGETADALEELRWAVVLAPERLSYRYSLLGAYCGLRMVEAAKEEADAILKLEPDWLNRQLLVRWLMAWSRLLGVR